MTNITSFISEKARILTILLLIAAAFTSCIKDDDYVPPPPVALVSVVNASPGSQPVDFYLDQNLASNYPVEYGQSRDYINAYTGKRTASFYVTGTQNKIKSDTMTLQGDKFYTVFLANTPGNPDLILVKDSISQPAAGMATIRLVNVSADAPAVDLAIGQGAVLASSKAYKAYSSFVAVQGNANYTLEIRQAGTSNVLVSLPNVNLKSNSVYTVWLQGLASATDDNKLSARIQLNAYYF